RIVKANPYGDVECSVEYTPDITTYNYEYNPWLGEFSNAYYSPFSPSYPIAYERQLNFECCDNETWSQFEPNGPDDWDNTVPPFNCTGDFVFDFSVIFYDELGLILG